MSENQRCYVCNRWLPLVESRVTSTRERISVPITAQCARCLRYICSDHAEMLDLSPRPWFSFGRRTAAERTMCCPFDPGVPLGEQEW
ncbi:MAG TPA: hypothetical protein VHL59_03245 [Thermoanaerobaculia bacterium]|nr:hypothetical protein [Thermoanaerobaculia bacterium]